MNPIRFMASTALGLMVASGSAIAQDRSDRPNILLIVADDLGYADLGAYGGEIPTPNIDRLANAGVMFTRFYAHASCAVTRSMLLTGVDNHLSGVGAQAPVPHHLQARAGYEARLSHQVVTVAELLGDAGYRTTVAGKWHLGEAWEYQPQSRGFAQSAVHLEAAAAHVKQPNMEFRPGAGFTFMKNGKRVEVPEDYYSTTYFTDNLIEAIGDGSDEEPFFAFAAYTAPHWPLQAPPKDIESFQGKYDAGWEQLARQRIARQKELGVLTEEFPEQRVFEGIPAWDSLDGDEKAVAAKQMEIYAAMVSVLDREVGRILSHLETIGQLRNTVVIFMSDNGAEGDLRGANWWANHDIDNSLENMGRTNSYVEYGPGWAQAGTVPGRMWKFTGYDGGNHVPAMFYWPENFPSRVTDVRGSVMDITPTILGLAGVEHPGIRYKNRDILPMDGISMVDFLSGAVDAIHSSSHVMVFESTGFMSLRRGDWKLVYNKKDGDEWRLYNMTAVDPERNDLAGANPDIYGDMKRALREWASSHNVWLDEDDIPRGPTL